VLKDPEKRAAYDRLGSRWQAGEEFRRPPDWDEGFTFRGGGYTGADPHSVHMLPMMCSHPPWRNMLVRKGQ
jgi:DnaJ-class molecular chaperone